MNPSPAVLVVSDEEVVDAFDNVLEVDAVLGEVDEKVVVAEDRSVAGELRPAWGEPLPHAESAATTRTAGIT